eukprot:Gregarina_sp_Poly_1__6527@NODE_349_length_9340_cov_161_743449_g292_i0_p9_GENE_NODE_349_length_9340_cov_161_743449_g292_i0NODE_349_length_9340_cov_161_743449_g292_i0_p9_ORF_typecomplete_len109_score14_77_NODE_349_length_9340_cov_161_743449_g292_i031357
MTGSYTASLLKVLRREQLVLFAENLKLSQQVAQMMAYDVKNQQPANLAPRPLDAILSLLDPDVLSGGVARKLRASLILVRIVERWTMRVGSLTFKRRVNSRGSELSDP